MDVATANGKLTTCSECGGTVSPRAKTCPHCGFAFDDAHVTVEQTKKVYKFNKLCGAGVFFVGLVLMMDSNDDLKLPGLLAMGVGGAWYAVATIAAWWNHG